MRYETKGYEIMGYEIKGYENNKGYDIKVMKYMMDYKINNYKIKFMKNI